MAKPICELAQWEVDLWREQGIPPNCNKDHRHISKLEACEKTCFGEFRPYSKPIAAWVGPRQILLQADRVWRPKVSGGAAVMQLVPGTAQPQIAKPPAPERFIPRGLPSIRARKDSRTRRSLAFSIATSS